MNDDADVTPYTVMLRIETVTETPKDAAREFFDRLMRHDHNESGWEVEVRDDHDGRKFLFWVNAYTSVVLVDEGDKDERLARKNVRSH